MATAGITGGTLVHVSAARANETVWSCGTFGNTVFNHHAVFGINTPATCPGNADATGGLTIETAGNTVAAGQRAYWEADAPPGLVIVGASVPAGQFASEGVNDGRQYGGGFYWAGGGQQTYDSEPAPGFSPLRTGYFGWQMVCGANPCRTANNWISVSEIALFVQETVSPGLVAPDGLWQSSGWVRGDWTLHFAGDSPSGLCELDATLNGQAIPGTSSTPVPSLWHQCSAPAFVRTIHTEQYGRGSMTLSLHATDAAGLWALYNKTIKVDNEAPAIELAGPTDAPATNGIQHITATAEAGPSGVRGIVCSVDGSPFQFHPGTSTELAVQGVGIHRASCYAENNAVDQSGNPGTSPVQTWTLSIREPSVSTVSFSAIRDALRCAKRRVRVRVPSHWITAHYRGRAVRVRVPAQTRTISVVRCRPRIVRRRVRVRGHWRTLRVVALPHAVLKSEARVPYGRGTTVSGWLGTVQGNALAGRRVRIVAAPDNGHWNFAQAAVAITRADGTWTARLRPGPSRLIEAVYDGDAAVEPTTSAPARSVVPASLGMDIRPHATHWGATIQIRGRVRGGYIPRAGELVVLWIGWPGGSTEIGHLYTHRDGRFGSTYTFLRGNGRERYHLWAATAKESDYPYAPNRSRPVGVTVTP